MKVTVYKWDGTPDDGKRAAVGEVTLDDDGKPQWDDAIDRAVRSVMRTPRMNGLTGPKFLSELADAIDSPPYLWGELTL
jgi:hypothetical protein